MRQGQTGRNAYRFTVRQLESLIRLSEAMARMHCDEEIKPSYVREVCRLLKQSNINIIKGDIEMEQNQEAINVERQQARDQENANIHAINGFTNGANNNLFVSQLLFDTFLGYGERAAVAITAQVREGHRRRASEGPESKDYLRRVHETYPTDCVHYQAVRERVRHGVSITGRYR